MRGAPKSWLVLALAVCALGVSQTHAAWINTQPAGCKVEVPDTTPDLRGTWSGTCREGKAEGRGLVRLSNGARLEGEFRQGQPFDAEGQTVVPLERGELEMQRITFRAGQASRLPLVQDPNLMRLDVRSMSGRWEWRPLRGDCVETHDYMPSGAVSVRGREAVVDYLFQLYAMKKQREWMVLVRTAVGGNGRIDCNDVALTWFGETRRYFLHRLPGGLLRVCMQPDESTCVMKATEIKASPARPPAARSGINTSQPQRGLGGANPSDASGRATEAADEIVFDRHKGAFYALYGRALRSNDKLAGKIVFDIDISTDGTVTDCRIISSELRDPELEKKMVARIRLIRFAVRNRPATIRKPLDFFPAA